MTTTSVRSLGCLLLMLMASGCGIPYMMNGVTYRDPNDALAAQSRSNAEQLAKIRTRPYMGGSLLVYLPSDVALTAVPFITMNLRRGEPRYGFFVKYYHQDFKAVSDGILRSKLFDSVTLKAVEGYEAYAHDFGYRFVLINTGRGWQLTDVATGQLRDVTSPMGLENLVGRIESAARFLSGQHAAPVAKAASPKVRASDLLEYKDKLGRLTVSGVGIDARAQLIAKISAICATKNVGLKAGEDSVPEGGVYTLKDERLANDRFTIDFECLY